MTSNRLFPTEWEADVYHRVSSPHVSWGQRVLTRLPLYGTETVVDAGCGTGRLTAELLEQLPHGRVIAIDQSANMLAEARAHLLPRFGERVEFLQEDLQHFQLQEPVDAIFSTAAFHWILDHPRLFRALHVNLKPGGRLVAQCGGGPNIAALVRRTEALLASAAFRHAAPSWRNPWEFASPELTAARLSEAGFVEIETGLEHRPTVFADADAYREFVASVVLRTYLDAIEGDAHREAFMDTITAMAIEDDPPFTIDYWRLNLVARRPTAS